MGDVNSLDPLKIQDLLFRKLADLATEPRFQSEIARAEREFFGANPNVDLSANVCANPAEGANAARFSEWFLLERESEGLGDVPARVLAWPDELRDVLLESQVGVYMVKAVLADEISVLDLGDGAQVVVAPIEGADVRAAIRPGDLLVGRLYPDAMDCHVASCAMAVQRQAADLAAAFQHDLERLDLGRRLSQAEIEHLMFRGRTGPEVAVSETPVERLEAELDRLFRSATLDDWSATAISQAFCESETPGPVVNPILEKVAFDSNLDISEVQRLLLELWGAHRHKANGGHQHVHSPAESEPLGEQLARRIEEGLAHNEDLEDVFAEVGEWIGVDLSEPEVPGAPGGGVAGGGVQDGDLPALVREYCWETSQTGETSHDQVILDRLVQVQQNLPLPELDLEGVTSRDLARLLLQIYLESAPQDRAAAVAAAFGVLDRFYRWCVETQAMELEPVIHGCRQELVEQVPRLQAAGLALSASRSEPGGDTRLRPMVARVANVDSDRVELTLERSPDPVTLDGAGAVCENLREGDILLGSLTREADGRGSFVGMVVAMPPIAADLIG